MKWVGTQKELDAVARELAKHQTLAVDTEADSLHSYFDKVCLIQVTADGQDYLIDPLQRLDLSPLGAILQDRSVTKILHGADYDLRILNRDFGFSIANLIDTMICAQLLGYEAIGLAALLKRHFNLDVDKSHQRADWAQRPLSPAMIEYAAMDTRRLVELASILRSELMALGRWEWAVEEFSRLEGIRFRESERDPDAFRKVKGSARLQQRNLAALQNLYGWRDELARKLDRPAFKILSNETLLELSSTLPRTRDALSEMRGMSREFLNRNAAALLTAIEEAVARPADQLPSPTEAKPWRRDKELERRIDKLKKARDTVATELKIDPAVLAPRHMLTAVALRQPKTVEDLADVEAMRNWQRTVVGEALVRAANDQK